MSKFTLIPQRWRDQALALRGWHFFIAAALLLLAGGQVIWGICLRDLSSGDTSSYYRYGLHYIKDGGFLHGVVLAYSPLYCAFYGCVTWLFDDAGTATMAHRLIIVLLAALATLALARQVLPRGWAWFVAAWWLALRINWLITFDVHLFSYALAALACALAGVTRAGWGRGVALAVMAINAAFLRNEMVLGVALFGAFCLIEVWCRRREIPLWRGLAWLALPPALSLVAVLFALMPHFNKKAWSDFRQAFQDRQRICMRQIYPLGYVQRHTDWKGDPAAGDSLVQRDFGRPDPTFGEALRRNPRAALEHFGWNAFLAPLGVQLSLFDGYTGPYPPDWAAYRQEGWVKNPWLLTLIFLAVCGAGTPLVVRRLRRHRRFRPGAWTVVALACTVVPSVVAILLQRPRPNYLFPISLSAMLYAAFCARLLCARLRGRVLIKPLPVLLGLAALIFFPSPIWHALPGAQPLLEDYRRLRAFQPVIAHEGHTFCANTGSAIDLDHYLSRPARHHETEVPWAAVAQRLDTGKPLNAALDDLGVTDLYLRGPADPKATATLAESGWRNLALVQNGEHSWQYWARDSAPAPAAKPDPS